MIENVNNVNSAFSYKIFTTPNNLASLASIDHVHSYLIVHIQALLKNIMGRAFPTQLQLLYDVHSYLFKQIFFSIIKNVMKNIMVEASPTLLLYGGKE